MYSLILEGEGGPTKDRENSLIFFLFFIEPFPKEELNHELGLALSTHSPVFILMTETETRKHGNSLFTLYFKSTLSTYS